MWRKLAGLAALFTAFLSVSPGNPAASQPAPTALQPPTVMMVIDTSGSMAGARLDQAKAALTSSVDALAPGQAAGLRSYGGPCGDGGTVRVPLGTNNRDQLRSEISGLSADGSTPTPEALQSAAADLGGVPGPRVIVLVSDGQSTCGDPCPTAEAIKRQLGIDFNVHTVGFQAPDAASGERACIARVTGGQYFQVTNAAGLAAAIRQVITGTPPSVGPNGGSGSRSRNVVAPSCGRPVNCASGTSGTPSPIW